MTNTVATDTNAACDAVKELSAAQFISSDVDIFFIFSSSLCIHVLKWLTTKNNNIFLNKNMRTFRKIPRNGENSSDIHAHTENIYDELLAGLEYFKAVFEYFIDLLMDDDGILGKTCK